MFPTSVAYPKDAILALMAVVSVTMAAWWFPFYESFARTLPLSRQLRTAILNGQVFGLPLWLAVGWLAARRGRGGDTGRDRLGPGETLAARPVNTRTMPLIVRRVSI